MNITHLSNNKSRLSETVINICLLHIFHSSLIYILYVQLSSLEWDILKIN